MMYKIFIHSSLKLDWIFNFTTNNKKTLLYDFILLFGFRKINKILFKMYEKTFLILNIDFNAVLLNLNLFIFKGENDVSLSTVNSEMIQCSFRTEA